VLYGGNKTLHFSKPLSNQALGRFGLNGGTEDDIDDVYFRMKK
jgi:hypothetical protein